MSDNILKSTRVEQNEIIKAEDVNSGYEFAIKNVLIAMRSMLDARSNFIVGGLVKKGTGFNLTLEPIFGVNKDDGGFNPIVDANENIDKIAISPSGNQQRIDTVMIRGVNHSTNTQQRAFVDFDSGTKSLVTFDTENELILDYKVVQGIPGSQIAPARELGWIKIAEILIPANATGIDTCTVNPVTADMPGMENAAWTNEKDATYNLKTLADLRSIFRTNHESDGKHKAGSIGLREINLNGASNRLTGANIQNGATETICETPYGLDVTISNVLKNLAIAVTSLYNAYQKNGNYGFLGEVVISSGSEFDATTAIKIKSNGDSTANILIGNDIVLTLKKGVITVNNSYAPGSNDNAIATMKHVKSVDSKVSKNTEAISELRTDVNHLMNSSDVNEIYAKFTFGENVTLVTTEALTQLFGTEHTIDGININEGDVILVKDQTNLIENGIYIAKSADFWERKNVDIINKFFAATKGATNKGRLFYTPATSFEPDVDEITFSESMFAREPISNKIISYDENGGIVGSTVKATTEMIIPTTKPDNPKAGSIWFE